MRFKHRMILVTGAASGIGRALCELLGAEGASLALIDRNADGLQALEKSLGGAGVRCAAAVADVRIRAQVREAVDNLAARLGPVDILIASAGLCCLSGVDDLRVEKLEEIVQVNFLGVVYALDAVLPAMLRRGNGQVVGIASLAAYGGLPFETPTVRARRPWRRTWKVCGRNCAVAASRSRRSFRASCRRPCCKT